MRQATVLEIPPGGTMPRLLPRRPTCQGLVPRHRPTASYKDEYDPDLEEGGKKFKMEDFLTTAEGQEKAYSYLTITSAMFGTVAVALPSVLLSLVFGSGYSQLDVVFTRIAGVTMMISVAVEYSLMRAAGRYQLKSNTYNQLMAATIIKCAAYIVAFVLAAPVWTPALVIIYPTLAWVAAAINFLVYYRTQQQFTTGQLVMPSFNLSIPQTFPGAMYALFTLLYVATAATCYVPGTILQGQLTPISMFLKHTWAAGFILAAFTCNALRDAADRSRLSGTTFRNLNLGIACLEFTYSLIYSGLWVGGVVAGFGFGNIGVSLVVTAFCLYQYFAPAK